MQKRIEASRGLSSSNYGSNTTTRDCSGSITWLAGAYVNLPGEEAKRRQFASNRGCVCTRTNNGFRDSDVAIRKVRARALTTSRLMLGILIFNFLRVSRH
jgi:hypothetical protein